MTSVYVDNTITLEDVELWLLPPDLAVDDSAARVEAHCTEIKLTQGPLGQDTLTVKTALDSPVCTSVYSSSTALRDRWDGWVLRLQVRGTCVFEGPVMAYKIVWGGAKIPGAEIEDPGSTVNLTAVVWTTHLLQRRYVATSTGAQYYKNDYPNVIACDLIRTSGVTGAVVTPTGWQQGSETRDDFGLWTLACTAPAGAGTTMKFSQAVGNNLLDTILELCNIPSADADKLWPTWSRSGTTITISFLRGRSGGSRQIGTDRTSNPVSAERGNLVSYEEEGDRVQKENHIGLGGDGRGSGQRRRYRADAGSIGTDGVYEGWEALQEAYTDDELDQEGDRMLFERVDGFRRRVYGIAEVAGFKWPANLGIADTLAFCIPVGEQNSGAAVDPQTEETNVIGLEWTLSGKGPSRLKLTTGQWPVTPERDLGRSGGGGRGGRGGGGRPKSKSGSPKNAADGELSYAYVKTDNGDTDAEAMNHFLSIKGKDAATYIRARTFGTDSANSALGASPDGVEVEIIGTVEPGAVDPDLRMRIKDGAGNVYYVPVELVHP